MNRTPVLFLNVLILATCGLVYELLAGTLASYVLGDSVTQFSLVIGIYLFAMGVGAWLSRFIDRALVRCFVEVEFGVALLGGCSAPLLLLSFARLSFFSVVLYGAVFAIGVLVGLELPLLDADPQGPSRLQGAGFPRAGLGLRRRLVASLLFPIFCVPRLGLTRTSLVFGMLNALVGLWATWLLRPLLGGSVAGMRVRGILVVVLLGVGLWKADYLTSLAEADLFNDPVVYAKTTPYQRIVVTAGRSGFQLFLNGHLQFHSADEYRYHEALVHPAMALAGHPRRVLVLGGGDGLALREILKNRLGRSGHAGRSRCGDDRSFRPLPAAGRIERPRLPRSAGGSGQPGRHDLAHRSRDRPSTWPSSIFPIPIPTPWASSTRRGSIASCSSGWPPRGPWPCNALRRFSRGSRSGASFARWRRPGSSCGPTTPPCRRSGSGDSPWPAARTSRFPRRSRRAEVPHAAVGCRHVRPAGRPGAAAGGGQSARQPGLGPLSRHRLEALGIEP